MTFLNVEPVTFEHHRTPLGIGETAPRLSLDHPYRRPGWSQRAYEIEISDGTATGRHRRRDESVLLAWPAAALRSRERRAARVRVHGRDGSASDWSPWSWAEAGLLDPAQWQAGPAAPPLELLGLPDGPAPLLRRGFTLRAPVASARLYVTALGVYEVEINGAPVGDDVLAPGLDQLPPPAALPDLRRDRPAAARAATPSARSWATAGTAAGSASAAARRNSTATAWRCSPSSRSPTPTARPSGSSPTRAGARARARSRGRTSTTARPIDARLEPAGLVGGRATTTRGWAARPTCSTATWPAGRADRAAGAPDRDRWRRSPSSPAPAGRDHRRLRPEPRRPAAPHASRARPGTTITLRHAEVLEDGELCTAAAALRRGHRPLHPARRRARRPGSRASPFHGFRYAEVDGWPGELRADDVAAVVCHSDLERTGWFECSDPLLNRLHENVVWSMRGNFLDIPTDCPQRDERLGWTGDIQVFAPDRLLPLRLRRLPGLLAGRPGRRAATERHRAGRRPGSSLDRTAHCPAAAWGDAAVDRALGALPALRRRRHAGRAVREHARLGRPGRRSWPARSRLWDSGFQFGDWLDPAAPPERPGEARTDPVPGRHRLLRPLGASWSAEPPDLLGDADDAARYRALAAQVRAAFAAEYVTPDGPTGSATRRPPTRWPCSSALLGDAQQRAHAGRAAGRARRAQAATASAPASSARR